MKTISTFLLLSAFSCFTLTAGAQAKKPVPKKNPAATVKPVGVKKPVAKAAAIPGIRIKLTTDSGVMIIRLYDKTPLHRDNFVKLVKAKFFDSLLFHRVIQGFMIQGGDPQSKNAPAEAFLGSGDVGYTIPAEFDSTLFHKKGALAAARTDNPQKASSGCQFYIAQGKVYSDGELNMMEMQTGVKISAKKRAAYKTIGGIPFLDMNYTVFGEVEKGLEVIDKIASVPKGQGDRPLGDVHMYAKIIN